MQFSPDNDWSGILSVDLTFSVLRHVLVKLLDVKDRGKIPQTLGENN